MAADSSWKILDRKLSSKLNRFEKLELSVWWVHSDSFSTVEGYFWLFFGHKWLIFLSGEFASVENVVPTFL
jgi:hypothetical protein